MSRKKKIQLEYIINCSPKVLFNRLSTPSGLAEWFADDVRMEGKVFTFIWKGSEEAAELSLYKENKLVRFTWKEDEHTYFEFRILQDELTGDVALLVTDFGEDVEKEEIITLWNNHISLLRHVLGS
ncbi:MAG TPA: START-like domain-containing protein [Prolixibacteraceae bacterium]|jgi:uncharacterized protein YndB with AHSA1/START domain|nr:SRPBCC domain-containing protein [Bacteroidales bacterium]HPJ77262.1 START-like domain-containing protein [Prolixibacteraceae bacterium]HRV89084.1 START-like domain-containing protein [Prolixibacteraceae bacterium]